jgi:phytol kinase
MNDVQGALLFLGYYLVAIGLPTILFRVYLKAPFEIVRKWQHIGHSLAIFLLLETFSTWYAALATAFLLVVVAYPVLWRLEGSELYARVSTDRSKRGGELKKQLLFAQLSFGTLIFLFWGVLGSDWRHVVGVAVMGWGFGDAAAALVGKAFGRNTFAHPAVDRSKTQEGTTAMIVAAGVALFVSSLLYAGQPWTVSLLIAVIVAPICGVVELFSRNGIDTITVPFAAALVLLPIVHAANRVG